MLTDKEIHKLIDQGPEEAVFILIKQLLYKNEQLEKRIQTLEAIINKNSKNSSKPPIVLTCSERIRTIQERSPVKSLVVR